MTRTAVFLIRTSDRKGLVAEITGFFASRDLNIMECRQYTDILENRYYMRIAVELPMGLTRSELESSFAEIAAKLNLEYSVHYSG